MNQPNKIRQITENGFSHRITMNKVELIKSLILIDCINSNLIEYRNATTFLVYAVI